ncbi:protein Wnt-4-like [Watersipora subatra]|uniref:protein Wnt-4-like n=1 Tax=Watersipora subatra TaxID=2589382 RepID=UPI00355B22F2
MLPPDSSCLRLLVILHIIGYTQSIQWLALHKWDLEDVDFLGKDSSLVKNKEILTRRQLRLFTKNPGLSDIILHTAHSVVSDCQAAFNNSRWNCSSLNELPTISPELQRGTREQAYVYALAAAQITINIAVACSKDSLSFCRCRSPQYSGSAADVDSNDLFQTSGCSVNLKIGSKLSERFTDLEYKKYKQMISVGSTLPNTESAKEAAMNIHNSMIGRMEVKNAITVKCKCHGMSGSCELKTCWNDLDRFKLHNDLLKMYDQARPALREPDKGGAIYVPSPHNKRESPQESKNLLNIGGELYDTPPDAFVFYTSSSDYCNRDPRRGSYGTTGRKCGDEYQHSCDTMCCGRGYIKVIHTKTNDRCNCRHIWCCYVECDVCKVDVTEYYCK